MAANPRTKAEPHHESSAGGDTCSLRQRCGLATALFKPPVAIGLQAREDLPSSTRPDDFDLNPLFGVKSIPVNTVSETKTDYQPPIMRRQIAAAPHHEMGGQGARRRRLRAVVRLPPQTNQIGRASCRERV